MESAGRPRDPSKSAFAALGLAPPLLEAVVELGYEEPTPIQRAAIPALLAGRDVLGEAATGTGKTAAFALPLLQRLGRDAEPASARGEGAGVEPGRGERAGTGTGGGARAGAPAAHRDRAGGRRGRPAVRALVLVPTRELAIQVADAMHRYGRALPGRILPVYGGQPIHQQLGALRHGVDAVVATPGRALDHVRRGSLVLDAVEVVVLDEADEMLDMGFAEDLEALLATVPAGRQAALFSATMPRRIASLAERHLRDPVRITIPAERVAAGEAPRLRQLAYVVPRREKIEALVRVLEVERPGSVIVFCRTRTEVDELAETLAARGHRCEPLHAGRSQEERQRVMRRFRDGAVGVLVATDVAARGLDVEQVSHVINFDVPCSVDAYRHRVGRTGRAGRRGTALTFAEPRERRQIGVIERVLKQRIPIAAVPTVEEVQVRRLELTAASVRAAAAAGDLAAYRAVAERLAAELDPLDVASAALKLVHERDGGGAPRAAGAPAAARVSAADTAATRTRPRDPGAGTAPGRAPERGPRGAAPFGVRGRASTMGSSTAPGARRAASPARRSDASPAAAGARGATTTTVEEVSAARGDPSRGAERASAAPPSPAAAPLGPRRPNRRERREAARAAGMLRSGPPGSEAAAGVVPPGGDAAAGVVPPSSEAATGVRPPEPPRAAVVVTRRRPASPAVPAGRGVEAAPDAYGEHLRRPRAATPLGARPRSADTAPSRPPHGAPVRPRNGARVAPGGAARARASRGVPGVVRLRVGIGKRAGLRPADLVGAIANETGVAARAIGGIEIGERSATVDVPAAAADVIMRALAATTIRGRRVRVQRAE